MIEKLEQFKAKIDRNSARLNKLGKWGEFFVKSLPVFFSISSISLVILIVSLFFPKEYQNKISFIMNIVIYSSMFYILFSVIYLAKKEKINDRKLEKKMFGITISNKLKHKDNIDFNLLMVYIISIVSIFLFFISKTNNELYAIGSGSVRLWEHFKFLKEKNKFENNFHISLKEMNKNKSKGKLISLLLSIRLIYKQLYEYQKNSHPDNRKFITKNYNYIIKSNLDGNILYDIFVDNRIQNAQENDYTLFSNIKLIIEKYGLFENLKDINEFSDEQKEQFFCYPLLSYLGNHGVISYIFQQNRRKYIEKSFYDYMDYLENEEDPIFYLSLIIYDEKETFPSILNRKLNDIEFSNIHSRNLFILQCIAYSVYNTELYKKYKNTTKNILSKTTQFLDNQIDDESNDTNTVELLNTFNHCIYECMERNKDENKSSNLIDILLNILEETEYHISTTLLLSRIIVFKKEKDWNDLRTVLEEMFEILHPFDKIEETRNEQIKRLQTNEIDIKITEKDLQRYRKNKQRLANFIAANKDKLHTPIMKK